MCAYIKELTWVRINTVNRTIVGDKWRYKIYGYVACSRIEIDRDILRTSYYRCFGIQDSDIKLALTDITWTICKCIDDSRDSYFKEFSNGLTTFNRSGLWHINSILCFIINCNLSIAAVVAYDRMRPCKRSSTFAKDIFNDRILLAIWYLFKDLEFPIVYGSDCSAAWRYFQCPSSLNRFFAENA